MEEETFFQLTGYPDEAWEAGRLKTYKKTLKIYTGASILAGTLMLGAGYLYAPALGDAAAPVAYTAGGILFSSLVSLVLLKLAPDNYASLSYAQRIADDYNAGLK